MNKLQAIQVRMLEDIKRIEGGWHTLGKKMGCSDRALQKVLDIKRVGKPRLATLEKIDEGIKGCLADQEARMDVLLA